MAIGVLRVDFNEFDDDDNLITLLPEAAAAPEVGLDYHLLDADGNYCRGTLVAVDDRVIRVAPDWDHWWPDDGSIDRVEQGNPAGWIVIQGHRSVHLPPAVGIDEPVALDAP